MLGSPGRHLAEVELKVALAHLLTEYELQLPEERPIRRFYWLFSTPPLFSKIKIRSRQG
jgi:cytochrome P450